MSEHTKGPWRHSGAGSEIIGQSRVVATCCWCSGMAAEDEANARLIAAAPDLLDAAKAINARLASSPVIWAVEIAQMRAAIAKAEGRI